MIIRCLGNNKHLSIIRHTVSTLLRTFPCGRNWNIVIYILVIAYVGETQTPKNIQLHLIKRFHHSAIAATKRISFLQGCKKEESCGMVFSSNLKFPIWYAVLRAGYGRWRWNCVFITLRGDLSGKIPFDFEYSVYYIYRSQFENIYLSNAFTTRPSQLRNESRFCQGCKKEESCGMVFSSNL